ncbi:hypothetical protein BC629DRAFT_460284 [Irpex lacteus]|nr:hypothetical protein BC629DRAFT_460284 [Irpex lacteus]
MAFYWWLAVLTHLLLAGTWHVYPNIERVTSRYWNFPSSCVLSSSLSRRVDMQLHTGPLLQREVKVFCFMIKQGRACHCWPECRRRGGQQGWARCDRHIEVGESFQF